MKTDETYLDEFGEVVPWHDDERLKAVKTPLREDADEDGFRERLHDTKYDEEITEAVRAEEMRILDEELAEEAENEYLR